MQWEFSAAWVISPWRLPAPVAFRWILVKIDREIGRMGQRRQSEVGSYVTGPLTGYRVIDLTTMIAGPFATMLLGDQGADIIKVEIRGRGDHVRATANQQAGFSASFLNNNRNK